MKFNLKFFFFTVTFFAIEVLIATVFKNIVFVRSYLGDVLVVMLIYTFILSFFDVKNRNKLVLGIFIFSVLIELLQYLKIAELLKFKSGSWQEIVVGNSFSWLDVICYAVGCILILWAEKKLNPLKA